MDGRSNAQAQEQLVVLKGVAAEKEKAEESAKKAKAEADKVIEGKCLFVQGFSWKIQVFASDPRWFRCVEAQAMRACMCRVMPYGPPDLMRTART